MLTFLATNSFTVSPAPGLIIWTIVILVAICATVVTALKGHWIWVLAGCVTAGLACLYSAFLPPQPGSVWARYIARRRTSDTA